MSSTPDYSPNAKTVIRRNSEAEWQQISRHNADGSQEMLSVLTERQIDTGSQTACRIYLYSTAQYCQNSIENVMGHVRHKRHLFETVIVNNIIVNFHQRYYYFVRLDRPAKGRKPWRPIKHMLRILAEILH